MCRSTQNEARVSMRVHARAEVVDARRFEELEAAEQETAQSAETETCRGGPARRRGGFECVCPESGEASLSFPRCAKHVLFNCY